MAVNNNIDHSSRDHALLSASGSKRWLNCTPSPRMESKFENKSSKYGEEGTLAHEFAELNLKLQLSLISKREYNKLVKPFKESEYYSTEMEDYVQIHVDYVIAQYMEAKRKTEDAVLLIEEKVDFSDFVKDGFGTTDNSIIADGTLEVIDFKYGKGVKVYAENNTQGMLYGLGSLRANELSYDIHTVKITIVQPRLDSISSWEISAEDLYEWAEGELKEKAALAFKGEGELNPGEWCRFCRARNRCKALAEKTLEIAKEEFSDPELMTDEEIIDIYKKFPVVASYMKSIQEYLLSEALEGKKWPEHKLVAGKSNRAWTDKEKAEEILKKKKFRKSEYMSQPSLLGITAIEKLLGKSEFPIVMADVVHKPVGKPTLVHESDRRPEYNVTSAEDDFKD